MRSCAQSVLQPSAKWPRWTQLAATKRQGLQSCIQFEGGKLLGGTFRAASLRAPSCAKKHHGGRTQVVAFQKAKSLTSLDRTGDLWMTDTITVHRSSS
jgi:hypothetical protein